MLPDKDHLCLWHDYLNVLNIMLDNVVGDEFASFIDVEPPVLNKRIKRQHSRVWTKYSVVYESNLMILTTIMIMMKTMIMFLMMLADSFIVLCIISLLSYLHLPPISFLCTWFIFIRVFTFLYVLEIIRFEILFLFSPIFKKFNREWLAFANSASSHFVCSTDIWSTTQATKFLQNTNQ